MRCIGLAIFLFIWSFLVFAEDLFQQDLLSEEWPENGSFEALNDSGSSQSNSAKRLLDFVSMKMKGDLAYSDSLSLARASLRTLSEGAPVEHTYIKADVQFNYFNAKDDLLINESCAQNDDSYTIKINELWAQYSKNACNVKLGRQNIFWGNVEGTRALDVIAPLDLTEPLLTDFSLVRRSQDIVTASCFQNNVDFELFVIPKPLLDQYTVRQTSELERLEKKLNAEWGGRMTRHAEGLDLSVYYGRFFDNSPKAIIDLNTFFPLGIYVNEFELYGAGLVYALERLLVEVELSYQKELSFQHEESVSGNAYLLNKQFEERVELSLGTEYTTATNHQFASGIWFYEYEKNPIFSYFVDTYALNASWSKQYLNDDLTLSALVFRQKEPELNQFTFMADYLFNDYWSMTAAVTYQNSNELLNAGSEKKQDWTIQLSMIYEL